MNHKNVYDINIDINFITSDDAKLNSNQLLLLLVIKKFFDKKFTCRLRKFSFPDFKTYLRSFNFIVIFYWEFYLRGREIRHIKVPVKHKALLSVLIFHLNHLT